jgi:CDP-diacylglycerol--glycerol-3-phosphate 3-phosphatidyltransferase
MFSCRTPDRLWTEATGITLLRLALSLVFFTLAILEQDITYNYIALGIHWAGDVLDGFVARRFKQETIPGAELDLIADRIETLLFFVIFLHFRPQLYIPVGIYVLNFAFVDFYLGYQFNKFGIISPNYFGEVDPTVYRLNFSPPAKFINSTVVTLLLIFFPQLWVLAAGLAGVLLGVKSYSVFLLHRITGQISRPGNSGEEPDNP